MSHTEFNKKNFTNIKNIEKKISNLKDPFDRNFNLKKVSIDQSYPSYIRNNLNLFKNGF